MTADELRRKFNNSYGRSFDKAWPETYEVDIETYVNVCQLLFDMPSTMDVETTFGRFKTIAIGKHNGILFKGVELILKRT